MDRYSELQPILDNTKTYISLPRLLFNVISVCCGSLYFGYGIAYLSIFPVEQIRTEFKIEFSFQTTSGIFQGLIPMGALIGAGLSSILSRNLSRRNSLLFVCGLGIVGGVLTLISSFATLLVGRIIQGICVGLYSSICPLFINELSPIELSGLFGTLNQIFIVSGVIIANLLSLVVSDDEEPNAPITSSWRIIFGATILINITQAILMGLVYRNETPKYLILIGKEHEAKNLIEELYLPQYSDLIFDRIKMDVQPGYGKSVLSSVEDPPVLSSTSNTSIAILIGFHLALLQQMSGINVIVVYGGPILQNIVGKDLKKIFNILLQASSLIGCFGAATLIKRLGRKTLLQVGALVTGILLAIMASCYIVPDNNSAQYVIVGCLYLFMLMFGFSLGPVVWLYIPEILQPQWIPFTTLTNWAGATMTVMLFPILQAAMHTQVYIFYFLAVWCLGSFVAGHFLLVETKNKTEAQIAQEFQQKCK